MRQLTVALLAGLLLAGCTTADAEGQKPADLTDYQSQSIKWTDCADNLFERDYPDAYFDESDVQCATVKVPASYADANAGKDLTLTIMKDPASGTPDEYQGTLFSNPGGPGQSGIEYIQYVEYPQELRDAYDIIGVDPRGVGASSPVRCSDELDLRSYYELPFDYQSEADFNREEEFWEKYYSECVRANPHWWTVTTDNVVADFELLRQVLTGDEPFNFIGHSYGTVIGGRYISTYPEHVGRIVLDSPVKPEDSSDISSELEQTKSMGKAINRLFAKCAADTKCPGDSVREVQDLIIAARDRTLADEMQGFVQSQAPYGWLDNSYGESASLIYRALVTLSYWPVNDAYPLFKDVMNSLNEDWLGETEWLGLMLDGYDLETMERDNSYEILEIVNCLDTDSRDLRPEAERDADDEAFAEANPFQERFYEVYDYEAPDFQDPGCKWSWLAFRDDSIPDPPTKEAAFTNTSGKRVIVIGSVGDNVTPYQWSVGVAESLRADLVTYLGTGHGSLYGSSDCLDQAATTFLLTGESTRGLKCPALD